MFVGSRRSLTCGTSYRGDRVGESGRLPSLVIDYSGTIESRNTTSRRVESHIELGINTSDITIKLVPLFQIDENRQEENNVNVMMYALTSRVEGKMFFHGDPGSE